MYHAAIRAIPNNFLTLSTLNREDGGAVSILFREKKRFVPHFETDYLNLILVSL